MSVEQYTVNHPPKDQALSDSHKINSGSSLFVSLFTLIILIALYVGWNIRNEYLLSAGSGLGYALGIVGGSMMLLLLIYPLRKRFSRSNLFIFSTKNWFKIHMALGILGPLLVLYHCSFSFGSTNSNVALISMLLMVSSGMIGRFIYGKIHHGLYGEKILLKDLLDHKIIKQKQLNEDHHQSLLYFSDEIMARFQFYETALNKHTNLIKSGFSMIKIGGLTRIDYKKLTTKLRDEQTKNTAFKLLSITEQKQQLRTVNLHIATYLSTVRKITALRFHERLFSLWHMLHLPIFFMLVITGFIHVYAVHVY